jgi:hypothetical protein
MFDQRPELEPLFPPVTEDVLAIFVEYFGYPVPSDYLAFASQRNGLWVPGGVRYRHTKRSFTMTNFYGISNVVESGNLFTACDAYYFRDRVPPEYVPIGDCQSFERAAMSLVDGSIYYWHPPDAWEAVEVQTTQHLTKVADSFLEYWNGFDWDSTDSDDIDE